MTNQRYSPAIRERFLELTVGSNKMKSKEAAELLDVKVSTGYSWSAIARREGRWTANPKGGDVQTKHIEEHADKLLDWQKSGLKVPEMSKKLAELGCKHSSKDAVRDFFKRRKIKLALGRTKKRIAEPRKSGGKQPYFKLSRVKRDWLSEIIADGKAENRLVRRAQSLLYLDSGLTMAETARRLSVSPSTVGSWLKTARKEGINALLKFNYRGAKRKLNSVQIITLVKWIIRKLPKSLDQIRERILDRYGVAYSRTGLTKLLKKFRICFRRPKKYPRLAPLKKQIAFIHSYRKLVKSLGPFDIIVFIDGVHPENNARPRGFWGIKGLKYGVVRSSGRERVNIHGALDLIGGKFVFLVEETINGDSVIRLIEKQLETYRDNVARGGKIYMISDNAGYYKSKDVKTWLKDSGLNDTIIRRYLPPYSPHLNPIEFLWRVMHENVTHNRSYENFDHFKKTLLHYLSVILPRQLKSGEIANIVNDNIRPISTKGVTMINRVAA